MPRQVYTVQQRARFVIWFAGCQRIYSNFVAMVKSELGADANVPDQRLVASWQEIFLQTGGVEQKKPERKQTVRTSEMIEQVREAVEENPNVSIRNLKNQTGASVRTVHQMLTQDLGLYPYKAQTTQQLLLDDPLLRHRFALRMFGRRVRYPGFENNLVFFDEAHFHLDGVPNRQNFRTWASENPNVVIEEPLHSPRVTVLIGIGFHGIVGPFFFNGNVNGLRYLEMLRDQVLAILRQWPNFEDLVLVLRMVLRLIGLWLCATFLTRTYLEVGLAEIRRLFAGRHDLQT
jgi:hypothetical protein